MKNFKLLYITKSIIGRQNMLAFPKLLIILILSGTALKPVPKPSLIYIECELRRRSGVTLGMTRSYNAYHLVAKTSFRGLRSLHILRASFYFNTKHLKKRVIKKGIKERLIFYTGSGSPETLDLLLDPSPRA